MIWYTQYFPTHIEFPQYLYPVLSKDIARLTLDSLGFQKVFRFHNIPKSCYLYYYVL